MNIRLVGRDEWKCAGRIWIEALGPYSEPRRKRSRAILDGNVGSSCLGTKALKETKKGIPQVLPCGLEVIQ